MKNVFPVLLTFFLLVAWFSVMSQNTTDAKGRKQGNWSKSDENGNLIYNGTFKDNIPQGTFTYYYPNGKVRSILEYSTNGKSAKAVNYHPNGKKMAEGLYVETKKDGMWKYFNDLEIISAEENYKTGVPEGVWKTYYDQGQLLEEVSYLAGKKEGKSTQYFMEGKPKAESNYHNNLLNGSIVYWSLDGKELLTGTYHNDLKDGLWTIFKPDGTKECETLYSEGTVMNETYFDKKREAELNSDVPAIPE
jgi:antitoxin component YwqK of YwqJK toxin-antitoxin module